MSSPSGNSALIPVQAGERLADRYLVERVVGTGGMGVVVAARHEQLGRTVAIKILTMSTELHPEAVERFLREARAAASLRSEHIARVMDVGTDERGRHFIVMEYLEGEDLGSVVRREETLAIGQAVGYVLQACEALAEAHSQGIIHRDLKPENIFLTRRVDGSPLIKVLDFGISKMTTADRDPGSLSTSGPRSLLGSPLYMSPEQIRTPSSIDPRSDVWALGVILFELLTGRRPFQGQSLPDILASILTDVPPPLSTLRPEAPAALADVVAGCLEKDVDKRVSSVGVLAQSLGEWAPRWARDSAARAARMSGIVTQTTASVDLALAAAANPTPTPTAQGGGRDPSHSGRPRGLTAALLIGAVACGLLTLGAWWMYRAPPLNAAQARGAPASPTAPSPSVAATPVSQTQAATAAAPTAAVPGVANDGEGNVPPSGTATQPTELPAAAGPTDTATAQMATPERRQTTRENQRTGRNAGPTGVAISGAANTPTKSRRRASRPVEARPSTKEGAVPLDPLEGRK